MKTYGAVDIYIQVFLTSALVGDEWSASCTDRFIPEEKMNFKGVKLKKTRYSP
jgi:hypothetical protein